MYARCLQRVKPTATLPVSSNCPVSLHTCTTPERLNAIHRPGHRKYWSEEGKLQQRYLFKPQPETPAVILLPETAGSNSSAGKDSNLVAESSTRSSHADAGPLDQFEEEFEQKLSELQSLSPPPDLPPAPDWPCPVLTDEEIAKYLSPLYERYWGVTKRVVDAPKVKGRSIAAQLTGVFLFPKYKDALRFIQDIGVLAELEYHHPEVVINSKRVIVHTYTHSALRGKLSEHETILQRRTAAITLRDVRFAMLVQQLIEREKSRARGYPARSTMTMFQPLTVVDMMVAKTSLHGHIVTTPPTITQKCIVCGKGGHLSTACPKRFEKKPMAPCQLCGGKHWRMNCPKYRRSLGHPCTYCGETGHGVVDCAERLLWDKHRAFWTDSPEDLTQAEEGQVQEKTIGMQQHRGKRQDPKAPTLLVPEDTDLMSFIKKHKELNMRRK